MGEHAGSTDMAARIRALARDYPGLHLREVARQLKTSVALVEYHIPQLVASGEVELVHDARHRRVFPAGKDLDKHAIIALRDGRRLHIALTLLHGPATHAALAAKTGMGKSTLSFHLRRLESAGLVTKLDGEYQFKKPAQAAALINAHRPTPNLLDRFSGMWDSLYRR